MITARPTHTFPFTALVGQETLKLALLMNAVDFRVGGVLIRGEKGTAKSTAVRALAAILPEMDVVEGCRFACDPADPGSWCVECSDRSKQGILPTSTLRPRVIDLPVSATEDRLVGTLNLEHALKYGERVFEPGLLAHVNRSILYVDEVNLLDDHLVDTLLDAAAMGVNIVEREGISFQHPARFILVGTMNPEEGEVRPQLLDRFGLCVDVKGVRDPALRVEIMKRRRAFEEDATGFTRMWVDQEDELGVKLRHARLRLPTVELSEEMAHLIALVCIKAGVDGHRADLVMARAACAKAALDGRTQVELDDLMLVAPMVLAHRVRKTPFAEESYDDSAFSELVSSVAKGGSEQRSTPSSERESVSSVGGTGERSDKAISKHLDTAARDSTEIPVPEVNVERGLDEIRRSIGGRRHETVSDDTRGRHVRSVQAYGATAVDLALDATIRSAAPYQITREGELAVNIVPDDLMTKIRKRKVGASIVLCVDASGSMGAADRIEAARAAVFELLVDAYQRRDRVGLVSFRGDGVDIVLPPTASVELAQLRLKSMSTGGATPLAAGMLRALELLQTEMRRNREIIPWLVLVTDGRANVGLNGGLGSEDARAVGVKVRAAKINTIVLDTGNSPRSVSGARDIAQATGGEYVRLQALDGLSMAEAVRSRL